MIDIGSLLEPHPPRTNFNLFWIDGAYTMRVAMVEDAFPWHYHPESDEAWLVLRGHVRIRTEVGDIELKHRSWRPSCERHCAIAHWRSSRARRC